MRPVGWNSKITTVARVAKSRCPRCTSSAPTEHWHGHRELHLLPSLSPCSPFLRGWHRPVHQEPQSHFPSGSPWSDNPAGTGASQEDKPLSLPCLPCLRKGAEEQSRAGCACQPCPGMGSQGRAAGALRDREQPMGSGRARDSPGKSRLPDSTTSNTSRWFLWVSQTYRQRGKGAGKVQQRTIKHIIFKAVRSLPKI